jgi:tRNA-2-methylthio-N6-dimethylallyladenosine synthase
VNHYRYEHGLAVTVGGREAPQIGPGLQAFRSPIPEGKRVTTFARLLQRIHDEVPAIQRLRFVTSYPRDFGRDILEVMRDCPRICRYLHAPAQSGSDRILSLMNRGYTRAHYEDFVHQVFEILPDATLAGDIIVGFPGETDEDFQATCDLVRTLPFKNNFIFKYSPRPGTIAIDRFPDDVPDEVKRLRNNQLLALQSETSARVHAQWVGREVDVLIEECFTDAVPTRAPVGGVELRWESQRAASSKRALRGRTAGDLIVAMDAPAGAEPESMVGQIVRARVDRSAALLLHGSVAQQTAPAAV